MKPLKEHITITLDNDILAKVRKLAEYDDRPVSQYINVVLKAHVAGIEAANNGQLFPNQE